MSIKNLFGGILPQRFLGVIPLYIGVEIVLGISVLNKAGGVYGVVSLLTGHPINFWQWLYNVLAISTLPFYIQALIHIKSEHKNVRKFSMATLIYTADTLVGLFYTLYFIHFWFSREEDVSESHVRAVKDPQELDLSGQSASQAREMFLTFAGTILTTVIRLYFNLVMLSFTKALIKQANDEQRYNDNINRHDEEVELAKATGPLANVRRAIFQWEIKAKEIVGSYL